jgi:hypothetical protein
MSSEDPTEFLRKLSLFSDEKASEAWEYRWLAL